MAPNGKRRREHRHSGQAYLVNLGLDEEELNERGRALDGSVDVLQGQGLLVNQVVVLSQEILHPQQRGRRLLLAVICAKSGEDEYEGQVAKTSCSLCSVEQDDLSHRSG